MAYRGLQRRADRKRRHNARADRESAAMRQKYRDKIKVYHDTKKADQEGVFFIVEFNLSVPMSANDLLEVLMNRIGEII